MSLVLYRRKTVHHSTDLNEITIDLIEAIYDFLRVAQAGWCTSYRYAHMNKHINSQTGIMQNLRGFPTILNSNNENFVPLPGSSEKLLMLCYCYERSELLERFVRLQRIAQNLPNEGLNTRLRDTHKEKGRRAAGSWTQNIKLSCISKDIWDKDWMYELWGCGIYEKGNAVIWPGMVPSFHPCVKPHTLTIINAAWPDHWGASLALAWRHWNQDLVQAVGIRH